MSTEDVSSSMNVDPDQPSPEHLLSLLRDIYGKKAKTAEEFEKEVKVYSELLPGLIKKLNASNYVLKEPRGLGSTAIVWVVFDRDLKQKRALKLPRPRLGKIENIVRVMRSERERLAALNHQNIIKIFTSGEIDQRIGDDEYSFPYFIMEFLEDIQDIDEFIVSNLESLTADEIIVYFQNLLSGLSFLHSQSIVHCDIKPGNLLKAPHSPALIADLGYAKHLYKITDDEKLTEVIHTPAYAHPELRKHLKESTDSAASIAEIPRSKLRAAYDLFAFGRSMQRILELIRKKDRENSDQGINRPTFTHYQWVYLGIIAKRLLDGVVERPGDDLQSDSIPGLPDDVMYELKYNTADDALEDFEKLLHLYDLEGEIPELNPHLSSFVQIPHCSVPFTSRVQEVINHPSFARLAQVTQLGFVSLVYPGANHTRFEHVLGTFAHACHYVRALWYDQANGMFQSIMSRKDLELGLLAALLHDIGQYPMAHDLTEIVSGFAHESLTLAALQREDPNCDETLAQVIWGAWGVDVNDIVDVMTAHSESPFKHRILHSLISGPLDCDKMDYLKRDSTHLGVKFGLSIDQDRLLRNLTIAYQSSEHTVTSEDRGQTRVKKLDIAEIAVTEKALVVAQSLWKTRKEMFAQVYWQHTTRALKSMLGYVVRNILIRLNGDEDERETFWGDFNEFVFNPMESAWLAGSRDQGESRGKESETLEPSKLSVFEEASELKQMKPYSKLAASDDALLRFLGRFASAEELEVIRGIQVRNVYRRLAVLSGSLTEKVRPGIEYDQIYRDFRTYRLNGEIDRIENTRKAWEKQIIEEFKERVRKDRRGLSPSLDPDQISQIHPLILVDVPLKATSRTTEAEFLVYLPEDYFGVHSREPAFFPRFERAELDIEKTRFDRDVGKIRVLSHPDWTEALVKFVPEEKVLEIISR